MATGIQNRTGYGRTRRPKNIAGADGTAVTNVADLAAATVVTNDSTNANKTGTGVYSTENQRYLHLSSYTSGTVVNVWGNDEELSTWLRNRGVRIASGSAPSAGRKVIFVGDIRGMV